MAVPVRTVEVLHLEVDRLLAELHARTGDPSYGRARSALSASRPPGRPAIDDRRALDLVAALLKQGARSRHEACNFVAAVLGGQSAAATCARLMRKSRTKR